MVMTLRCIGKIAYLVEDNFGIIAECANFRKTLYGTGPQFQRSIFPVHRPYEALRGKSSALHNILAYLSLRCNE